MLSVGRSRIWLAATVSILVVVLLIAGAYIAHHAVVNTRAIPPVSAPPAPPLTVVAVTSPGPSYELLAEDAVVEHGQELFPGVGDLPEKLIHLFKPPVVCLFEIGQEQSGLGIKMIIERGPGNFSLLDDLVDPGNMITLVVEQPRSRIQDPVLYC